MKGHFERNPDVMSPALNSLLRDMAIENELTLVRPPAGGVARGGLLAASRSQAIAALGAQRMPAFGASRPLRRIPAIVSFLNPQPAVILVCGNRSSCPKQPSGTKQ
jgi:hypothetical protein